MKKRLAKAVLMSLVQMSLVFNVTHAAGSIPKHAPIVITNDTTIMTGDYTFDENQNLPAINLKASNNDYKVTFVQGDEVGYFWYWQGGLLCENGASVVLEGTDLLLGDARMWMWSDKTDQYGMENNGNLKINNNINIAYYKGKYGLYNSSGAELVVDGHLHISANSGSVNLVNNGNVKVNGGISLYNSYSNGVENNGTFIVNASGRVNINAAVVHNQGAVTDIVLQSPDKEIISTYPDNMREDVKIQSLVGDIKGSSYGGFSLNIREGGVWSVDSAPESVFGVKLNGGQILVSADKYVFDADTASAFLWNDNYKTFKLNDFESNGSGFVQIATDLKERKGDKIEFMGETPDVIIPIMIINKNDNNGIPITPTDGYSVKIVSAPSDTQMDINANLGFYGKNNEIYVPIIETTVDDIHKNWNFVGWEEAEDNRSGKQESQKEAIDQSILVEDVEPIFKRFNDLRTDPSEIGVWVRGETGETKIRNLSYDHNIMSGGYDWDYKNDAGVLFAGVGFTYSTNECDDKAIGDTKGYGFNAYGSWLGKKNNDYVDLVVKYGKLDKSYAGYDENNIFVAGEYDKDLFTIAAKYGRRIFKDDWYYEPSVGLTWGRVGSADFTDNHGTRIHADNSYSNIASLGIQVGKNIKGIEYYGKAEVMHDFDGKIHVSAPGRSVEDDMGGTWVKCAIGASRMIDENNSFYLEVERDFGNKVEKPYGFSAGYRFTW